MMVAHGSRKGCGTGAYGACGILQEKGSVWSLRTDGRIRDFSAQSFKWRWGMFLFLTALEMMVSFTRYIDVS